ncbi:MAG: hypothetical protein IKH61_12335 [Bacteroidales bacterium]|nr:hypothetical protein [Bacteroidales bacterium]
MKLILDAFMLSIIVLGCNVGNNGYEGIPITAELVAEDSHYAVFTNIEAYDDHIIGNLPPIKQVSLWAYDKQRQNAEMMLLTHFNTDGSRYNTDESFTMPADTIPTIQRVTIMSYPDESLKLLVEGCRDYRNVESFIVELGKKEAIYLPSNQGFVGFTEEENLLIMQSYAYYPCGGRYNKLLVYSNIGELICSVDVKLEKYSHYPTIEELCQDE